MVEGPGCKLKGEKMKGRLKGKVVKGVSGNAVDREDKAKKKIANSVNRFDWFIGKKLVDVETLGKELFMFFGEKCFRVHFLMAGSFRINDQVVDHEVTTKANTESMLLDMGDDKVAFYKCAVDVRESAECRTKLEQLSNLDICSSTFNHKRAVQTFMKEENRLVCDVLLDQTILPGVGNIIKNEALFDSGIRPSSRVRELSEPLVSHLIRMTRDFSMIFYKCRKTGQTLRRYEKVYNRGTCNQCEGKITRTRMGEDSERMTYYCPQCQTNYPDESRILPTKNSLLGWVNSGKKGAVSRDWTCTACTLINSGTAMVCNACGGKKLQFDSPKAIQVPIIKPAQMISTSSSNERRTTNHVVKSQKRKGDPLPVSSPSKRLRSDVGESGKNTSGPRASASKVIMLANSLLTASKSDNTEKRKGPSVIDLSDTDDIGSSADRETVATTSSWHNERVASSPNSRVNTSSSPDSMGENEENGLAHSDMKSASPKKVPSGIAEMTNLKGSTTSVHSGVSDPHGSRSSVQVNVIFDTKRNNFLGNSHGAPVPRNGNRVRLSSITNTNTQGSNSSLNSGRSSRSRTGDGSLSQVNNRSQTGSKIPLCPNHNKKCALREVRKEGPNLGRMFFCCSLPRGKQCLIFKWADDEFPICDGHGKKCVLRTVLKEGPNNGRKFFACSVERRKQCKFFQWADEYNDCF